jgi:hypothetical protein
MFQQKCACLAIALAAMIAGAVPALGQDARPSPEAVAKLIAQLGAVDFRTRQQASNELQELGDSVVHTLRKAAMGEVTLETRRRIENVVERIENALLKAEEKHWQELDAGRRDIKERVVKILARTPPLSDQQATTAIYLVTLNRRPTDAEIAAAQTQFKERSHRLIAALQLARPLVKGKEYNADVAAANSRILKLPRDRTALGNDPDTQRLTKEVAVALNRAAKTDEQFCDLAFLLMLSRFPGAKESTTLTAHLTKTRNNAELRAGLAEDIIWALINTGEFVNAAR